MHRYKTKVFTNVFLVDAFRCTSCSVGLNLSPLYTAEAPHGAYSKCLTLWKLYLWKDRKIFPILGNSQIFYNESQIKWKLFLGWHKPPPCPSLVYPFKMLNSCNTEEEQTCVHHVGRQHQPGRWSGSISIWHGFWQNCSAGSDKTSGQFLPDMINLFL